MKLTDFFPATVLPRRTGVYEVKPEQSQSGRLFSEWNATHSQWGATASTPEQAAKIDHSMIANENQQLAWRGVAG